MANTKNIQGNTGNRYTDAQKRKILDFIKNGGRGSISAAQQKFNVSYIAIRSWMNKEKDKNGPTKPAGSKTSINATVRVLLKEFRAKQKQSDKEFAVKLKEILSGK